MPCCNSFQSLVLWNIEGPGVICTFNDNRDVGAAILVYANIHQVAPVHTHSAMVSPPSGWQWRGSGALSFILNLTQFFHNNLVNNYTEYVACICCYWKNISNLDCLFCFRSQDSNSKAPALTLTVKTQSDLIHVTTILYTWLLNYNYEPQIMCCMYRYNNIRTSYWNIIVECDLQNQ